MLQWQTTHEDKIRIEKILQHGTEIIVSTECGGNITWANHAFNIFRTKIGQHNNDKFFEHFRWQDHHPQHDPLEIEVGYNSGDTTTSEHSITIRWSRSALLDTPGLQILGYVYSGLDISKEKLNDRRLKENQAALAITNTELCNINVKLEAAVQIKNNFLSCMNHELRTPINGIKGMLRLLSGTNLDKNQSLYTSLAETSTNTLSAQINDILEFSTLSRNNVRLDTHTFNLLTTLSNCCQTLSLAAHRKGIDLLLDLNGVDQSKLIGDSCRLKQVVNILCGNAIKYTENGYVTVRATLAPAFEAKRVLTLNVIDTGIGLTETTIPEIVGEFTQGDSSSAREYGGIGLGLSIARQLCQLMGGDITVTSTPGIGSTFTATVELSVKLKYEPAVQNHVLSEQNTVMFCDAGTGAEITLDAINILGGSCNILKSLSDLEHYMENNQYPTIDIVFIDARIERLRPGSISQFLSYSFPRTRPIFIMLGELLTASDPNLEAYKGLDGHCVKPVSPASLGAALTPVLERQNATNKHQNDAKAHHRAQPTPHPTRQTDTHSHHNSPAPKIKLLIVDDNELNLMAAQGVLEELGYSSDTANNGVEALNKISITALKPYDLIFMDCQMPIMDGFEATRRIRAGEAGEIGKRLPIIALTANVTPKDKALCKQAGMNDFLGKPVDADAIDQIILKQFPQKFFDAPHRSGRPHGEA